MLDAENHTNLFYAIFLRHKATLLTCLEKGAEDKKELLNTSDQNGMTPLMLAVLMNRIEFVKILITNGANYKEVDGNNNSLLITATCLGYVEIVKFLSEFDISLLPMKGWRRFNALDFAILTRNKSIANFLSSKTARTDINVIPSIFEHTKKVSQIVKILQRMIASYDAPAMLLDRSQSEQLNLTAFRIPTEYYENLFEYLILKPDEESLLGSYQPAMHQLYCLHHYFLQFVPSDDHINQYFFAKTERHNAHETEHKRFVPQLPSILDSLKEHYSQEQIQKIVNSMPEENEDNDLRKPYTYS